MIVTVGDTKPPRRANDLSVTQCRECGQNFYAEDVRGHRMQLGNSMKLRCLSAHELLLLGWLHDSKGFLYRPSSRG
jgi:hypothetical protein